MPTTGPIRMLRNRRSLREPPNLMLMNKANKKNSSSKSSLAIAWASDGFNQSAPVSFPADPRFASR